MTASALFHILVSRAVEDSPFHHAPTRMKRLAGISWATIIAIAVAWPLAWLLVSTLTVLWEFRGTATSGSGGLAAVGLEVSVGGALLVVAPPILLLILRATATRSRSR